MHKNVVTGYLSILLLTVCFEDEARVLVQDRLPGDGLYMVLATAEKFLHYHRKIDKDAHPFESLEQGESRLTTRIEQIINRIRQLGSPR